MANIFFNKVDPKRIKTPEQLVESALQSFNKYIQSYDQLHNHVSTESVTSSNEESRDINKSQSSNAENRIAAEEELQKRLNQMKIILYGDGKSNVIDEDKALELAKLSVQNDLIGKLIENIEILPFEARKDTAHIFNNFVRKNLADFPIYVHNHHEKILFQFVKSYSNPDAALSCGSMLRECIRFDELATHLLYSEYLWYFFDDYVHLRNFEIASDSFNTLRDLLTTPKNKVISSTFLQTNYDQVMLHYDKLLKSDNFVTRWRSLKLLGDLLLDRSNFNIMMQYITSKENLKTIMNMIRDKSPNIQFESFHVFKLFVANPNRPPDVALVLYKNKDKLMTFLDKFYTDKEDAQFNEEKCLLITTLSHLTKPAPVPVPVSASVVSASAPAVMPSLPSDTTGISTSTAAISVTDDVNTQTSTAESEQLPTKNIISASNNSTNT